MRSTQIDIETAPLRSCDGTGRPLRVLVVDDDPQVLWMLERFFEAVGEIECTAASCGSDALARCDVGPHDVVLLDYELGDMTAEDVLFHLRARGALRAATTIVMSGNMSPFRARRLEGFGVKAVSKPLDLRSLRDSVVALRSSVGSIAPPT